MKVTPHDIPRSPQIQGNGHSDGHSAICSDGTMAWFYLLRQDSAPPSCGTPVADDAAYRKLRAQRQSRKSECRNIPLGIRLWGLSQIQSLYLTSRRPGDCLG